jgi:hypothetical protein
MYQQCADSGESDEDAPQKQPIPVHKRARVIPAHATQTPVLSALDVAVTEANRQQAGILIRKTNAAGQVSYHAYQTPASAIAEITQWRQTSECQIHEVLSQRILFQLILEAQWLLHLHQHGHHLFRIVPTAALNLVTASEFVCPARVHTGLPLPALDLIAASPPSSRRTVPSGVLDTLIDLFPAHRDALDTQRSVTAYRDNLVFYSPKTSPVLWQINAVLGVLRFRAADGDPRWRGRLLQRICYDALVPALPNSTILHNSMLQHYARDRHKPL